MKHMKRNTVLGVIVLLFVGFWVYSASQRSPQRRSDKLIVNTSFYPLYFFAGEIGKDKADVLNITPAGAEPHDYEPTAQAIARIEGSDMLVLNGAHLETWGDNIRENLQGKKVHIVVTGDDLADREVEEEGEIIQDPHVWLSPRLAKKQAMAILQGYIAVDPKHANYYTENANKLTAQLDSLDEQYRQSLAHCARNDIITSHAAFGYIAQDYGLNQVTITGISPDEEPSSKRLAEVATFARKNNVRYIFFESLVSPKLAETIAIEVGAQTLVLDPLEGLSEQDMKAGRNYVTIMEENLAHLRTALECQ